MRLPLTLISILCLTTLCVAAPPGVAVNWDPNHPNPKAAAIWMAYLLFRCEYRLDHKAPLPASGEITPSFDEEVYARQSTAQTYRELKAKDKDLHDDYWETLSQIEAKGFMKPYVWVHLHRSSWSENEKPNNLDGFENWSRSALKNHRAETIGSLSVQK
jgi:hypothetical protein